MKLISCENPVSLVRNGQTVYVPCGHCDLCRCRKSSDWVHRLQTECGCWKNAFFVTLTYDDDHLPFMEYDSKLNTLVDVKTGLTLGRELTLPERAYVRKKKKICYSNVRDFQLFIKRLRYYYYEYNKTLSCSSRNETLRYFITTELGPTTHRVHAHALIWFSDTAQGFSSRFAEFVYKCWRNGHILCEAVQGSNDACKYVAKYVHCDLRRFSLYKDTVLAPKALFSKCPPIGSLLYNDEYIKRLFTFSSPEVLSSLNGKSTSVPLPLYLRNRLWPSIPEFCRLSPAMRVSIYSIAKWSGCDSPDAFVEWVGIKCIHSNIAESVDNYLLRQVNHVASDPYASLKRIFRISRRVLMQCEVFGVSLRTYLEHLDKYFSNCDFLNLKKQYEFQESFSHESKHPIGAFLVASAPHVVSNLLSCPSIEFITIEDLYFFESYGINPYRYYSDKKYRKQFDFTQYGDLKDYIDKIHHMYNETSKVKAKKEYLRLHPNLGWIDKYNNIYLQF